MAPAVNWVKVGTSAMVGGAAGVIDELVQNQDNATEDAQHKAGTLAANKKLPMFSQWGTYFNYGVPLAAVVGVAAGLLKDDLAIMGLTAGFQLAGRKGTHAVTAKVRPIPPAAWQVWERGPAKENKGLPPLSVNSGNGGGGSSLDF